MQTNKATTKLTQSFPSRTSDDDIYDIPTSRETTPTSPKKEAARKRSRVDNEAGKKRKHGSAFSNISSAKFQQVSRPRPEPPTMFEASRKPKNTSPVASQAKSTKALPKVDDSALLPSAPIQPVELSIISKPTHSTLSPSPPIVDAKPRRRRLIDTLAAQRASSPASDTSDAESNSETDCRKRASSSHIPHIVEGSNYNSPSPQIRSGVLRTPDRRGTSAKSGKVKLTYSSSRSLLSASQPQNDAPMIDDSDIGLPGSGVEDPFAAPISPPPADFDFDDDESDGPKVGIQSVHELRRAGANNRFSDEMDDLLSRIGKPSSTPSTLRRNTLCELANKLQRKEFASQFRDHAARDNIVKDISNEEDIISAFALVGALVTFLSFSPAPHMLRQLTVEKVGKLLIRLFREQEDMESIIKQKHLNLSKTTQTSLSSAKASVLQMDIWPSDKPTSLSPRTLALQLLVLLSRYADVQCLEDLTADIEQDVASMVQMFSKERLTGNVDYTLAICALEAQSNLMSFKSESYSVAIKNCIRATLEAWLQEAGSLDSTALKLAINITNSSVGSSVFDDSPVLSSLLNSICRAFSSIQSTLQQGSFQNRLYDELLLILGIVINILEHCTSARMSVDDSSLKAATFLWLSNLSFINDADSVSKSKIGVALGYLAIVLGYLYLTPSGRAQMRQREDWPGLTQLIGSIQEFLQISKTIGNRTHELETLLDDLRIQQSADR